MKKSNEEIKFFIATLINQENAEYSKIIQMLSEWSLESAKRLAETLEFSHKEKLELLNKIYSEI